MNPIPSMGRWFTYLWCMGDFFYGMFMVNITYTCIHGWLIAPSKKHKTRSLLLVFFKKEWVSIRLAAAMLLFSLQPSVVAMWIFRVDLPFQKGWPWPIRSSNSRGIHTSLVGYKKMSLAPSVLCVYKYGRSTPQKQGQTSNQKEGSIWASRQKKT